MSQMPPDPFGPTPGGEPQLPPFPMGHTFLNPAGPQAFVINRWPITRADGSQGSIVLLTLYTLQGVTCVGMEKAQALAVAEAIRTEAVKIPDGPGLVVPPPGLHLPPIDPSKFRPGNN